MRPLLRPLRPVAILLALLPALPACMPHTVGSTAQPVPLGETSTSLTVTPIPDLMATVSDRARRTYLSMDLEVRHGISERSDIGFRAPGMTGLTVSYKRRLLGSATPGSSALSVMGSAGFIGLGSHGYGDIVLLASARERRFTPYAGLRAAYAPRISREVQDLRTAGGLLGMRIGGPGLGVSGELGVYRYRPPRKPDLTPRDWILVPAIVVHGEELIQIVSRLMAVRF